MSGIAVDVVAGTLATFFVVGIVVGVILVCASRVFRRGRWPGRRG